MTDHDDSILDRARNAVGMDTDDETTDDSATDRPDGWAGVDDALGGADREAGSVYEAEETGDVDDAATPR
jgi:hypothetical protein